MTSSELSMPIHRMASAFSELAANHLIGKVTAVTVSPERTVTIAVAGPGHGALSGNSQVHQQLQAVAPAENAGRRVGAGAGATPVSVAMIRHDTSLVRWLSLVGRSRTCPFVLIANLIANLNATRIRNEFRIRRRHHGNGHS